MFFISAIVTLILVFEGYLFGKVLNRFIPSLKNLSTTLLGVFIIFAFFQLYVFVGIKLDLPSITYVIVLCCILVLAPLLCLILKIDIKPKKFDGFAFCFALAVTIMLTLISKPLNTGAMFFDSNFYLSKVIESSVADVFGHISSYSGVYLHRIDPLYDYQGYYYFWGVILKIVRNVTFDTNISLTPIYIWSASLTYYMSLGYLIVMSCQTLYNKINYRVIIATLFITPYFINYFNTTLGFFGNTIKVIATGLCMLLIHLWLDKKDNRLFIAFPIVFLAGLSFSSSVFYLSVFITISFLFGLVFLGENNTKTYKYLILSSFPILLYGIILLTSWDVDAPILAVILVGLYLLALLICQVLSKCSKQVVLKVIRLMCVVFFVSLTIMIFLSFLLRNNEFGYLFYFELRSLNDMTLNFSNHIDGIELLRNLILWGLIVNMLYASSRVKGISVALIITLLLFLNPLTMPVIATYLTGVVYSRTFELLINPFVLLYLISLLNFGNQKRKEKIVCTMIGCLSIVVIIATSLKPYSRILLNNDKFNWEYKISDSEFEMMNELTNEIIKKDIEKPIILSQNINLKGYVSNVQMYYSSQYLRDDIQSREKFLSSPFKDFIVLFYPRNFINDEVLGEKPDYTNLCPVIVESQSDYVIMKTTLIYPNENGDFVPIWWDARACSDSIFDNDEWVILKVRK